jgi:hypothetical protein
VSPAPLSCVPCHSGPYTLNNSRFCQPDAAMSHRRRDYTRCLVTVISIFASAGRTIVCRSDGTDAEINPTAIDHQK